MSRSSAAGLYQDVIDMVRNNPVSRPQGSRNLETTPSYFTIATGFICPISRIALSVTRIYACPRNRVSIPSSAVPVFLGSIDSAIIYLLHGTVEICHVFIMCWEGEDTATMELAP
jgi:hypothetical protein